MTEFLCRLSPLLHMVINTLHLLDKWHDFKLDKQKHQMPLFYFQTTSGDWMGLELDYDASSLFDHYS